MSRFILLSRCNFPEPTVQDGASCTAAVSWSKGRNQWMPGLLVERISPFAAETHWMSQIHSNSDSGDNMVFTILYVFCICTFENRQIEICRIVLRLKSATKHARHPKPAQALSRLLVCEEVGTPSGTKPGKNTQKISTKNAKKNMKTCFGETASLAFEI